MPANFDGTNDSITLSIGACGVAGPFTFAALFRATAFSATDRAIVGVGAGGTATSWLVLSGTTGKVGYYTNGGGTAAGSTALSTGKWYIVAASKATGTAAPRIHYHDMTSPGTWTHENGSNLPDGSSASGGSIKIGEDTGGNKDFNGDIAAIAIWKRSLSDDEVEKLEGGLLFWGEMNPDCWAVLDQDTTTQKVVDLSGNGSNESARSGSTTSSLSAPLGWGDDVSLIERIMALNATLNAVAAAASAAANSPALQAGASVSAVAATATASATTPDPKVSVSALVAQAIAGAAVPVISATGAPQNVNAVAAAASAGANAPGLGAATDSTRATATAAATTPDLKIAVTPSAATAAAAANAPGISQSVGSQSATAAADAKNPDAKVAVTPSAATATATANPPGISQSVGSQPATATAAARTPGINIALVSAVAVATGEAGTPQFSVITIIVVARYAPSAVANAAYAPIALASASYAAALSAEAIYSPYANAGAQFASIATGTAQQGSSNETAQHAPYAEGRAVYV